MRRSGVFTDIEVAGALEILDASLADPESDEYRFVVAAEHGGPVVGYACFGTAPFTDAVFDLYWIAVDPSRTGLGLGRSLLEAVEDEVRRDAGRMIVIETASKPDYEPTRSFYERLGYREVARVPDFYSVGDDKVIYCKRFA